jgi:imidazolonepropionase-like amidohydrolase
MHGLDDRVGSLEVGKDADLVLWDGDPLDIMSRARTVLVEGRTVYRYDEEAGRGVTVDPYAALRSGGRTAR